ncbi:proline-rich basic protein 1 [Centrocercus urophasianus]|uniref:proline-rich basic protein 1 n=1 Tax=Centrocercus urophasianus TaxID=9002 RepID=UPI001C650084|nr:proline-rich basic protein 1 [Centrocercus urophasianus]
MIPRGKRDAGRPAELPDGAERHGSPWEEDGRLSVLPRDDLPKSVSDSSISSYHSARCSETTDTFKDCLEFLEEDDAGRLTPPPPYVPPEGPPPRGPGSGLREERARQPQLSVTAKNSAAPGRGGRMGPIRGDRPPVVAFVERPCAAAPAAMLGEGRRARRGGGASDSDEADSEVRALTARSFHSLSGPPGARLDMCSSSSLSNSLSEDGGGGRRWAACGEPRGTELSGVPAKELFECVDVELESGDAKKGYGKRRTVPKRQIQLKRKERKEAGFFPWGDSSAPQPLTPARKEPPGKGRAGGEDFRFNYKQFVKTASLDGDGSKTRMASSLVKNVLAKKMQYEQLIKMEQQKALRGSSTSSGPSSAGTDLLGDGMEGKSSSLSKSDLSASAEDVRLVDMGLGHVGAHRPAKGVVLSEATRENVCRLKKTFNELNERMRYQEVVQCQRLPAAEPSAERTPYWRARALFEGRSGDGKVPAVTPKFEKPQKPWPSLRQRAIRPSRPQLVPFEPKSSVPPNVPPRSIFTSQARDVRLGPQSRGEEKPPPAPREPLGPGITVGTPAEPGSKGKALVPQPRDVRKLLKSSYSLSFGAARGPPAPGPSRESTGEPKPPSPLIIHCTSVRRSEPAPSVVPPVGGDVGTDGVQEPAPARSEGTAASVSSHPAQGSPVQISKVQSVRREAATTKSPRPGPAACRQRSEIHVPSLVGTVEETHVESHLHVLVGPQSPPVAVEASPARSSAVLRMEKTLLLPPPPLSPTEEDEERGHGVTIGDGAGADQQRSSGDNPGNVQDVKPAVRSALKPPTCEQPGSQLASAGNHGPADSTGPTAPFQAREAGEGPSVPPVPLASRPPEQRETVEHVTKWPGASDPHLTVVQADNSNYLTIPVKAPKPSPKVPLVPSPGTTSFGTPLVPHPNSVSFGTPSVPNSATTHFGTPSVPNPATAPIGTPLVPHPSSMPFGTPSVPSPASASLGASMVPNPSSFETPVVPSLTSTSLGTPLVPSAASSSFGTPLFPYPLGAPFGTPLVPSPATPSFGTASVPRLPNSAFGTSLVPNPPSTPFATPSVPNPAGSSFGAPLVPNPSSTPFISPSVPKRASSSSGTPLVPNPATTSFGTVPFSRPLNSIFGAPLVPNPSSTPFMTPSVPVPASSSFGTPIANNPDPTSLGYPSISNVARSSFGSPLFPSSASAPLGTAVSPHPGGEAPWSKPLPEPPQPSDALAAAVPPAQPQPHMEDAPRRTEGSSPSSKSTPSPTRPFAPHPSAHRKMLVDPDSGKCYYMEAPRQPQLKTLYDPETGQYMEVLIPPVPVASHAGFYHAPFNPMLYGTPYMPYGSFPGLPAAPLPTASSPAHPDLQGQPPTSENPGGFPGTFSPDPKGEGPPAAGGPDCGYLESPYYIPTGMRASPSPSQPPARASPASTEKGPLPPL